MPPSRQQMEASKHCSNQFGCPTNPQHSTHTRIRITCRSSLPKRGRAPACTPRVSIAIATPTPTIPGLQAGGSALHPPHHHHFTIPASTPDLSNSTSILTLSDSVNHHKGLGSVGEFMSGDEMR
ncbi:hypothetical protein M758_1G232000 [Ceratodon purpureus]|nr:hypothetical protein M758_1G232000 [Ceratodon purpureus]